MYLVTTTECLVWRKWPEELKKKCSWQKSARLWSWLSKDTVKLHTESLGKYPGTHMLEEQVSVGYAREQIGENTLGFCSLVLFKLWIFIFALLRSKDFRHRPSNWMGKFIYCQHCVLTSIENAQAKRKILHYKDQASWHLNVVVMRTNFNQCKHTYKYIQVRLNHRKLLFLQVKSSFIWFNPMQFTIWKVESRWWSFVFLFLFLL